MARWLAVAVWPSMPAVVRVCVGNSDVADLHFGWALEIP